MSDIPVNRWKGSREGEARLAEEVLRTAVEKRTFPGAVGAAGSSAGIHWISGVGHLDYEGGSPVGARTIYDLASLTKVMATTSVVLRLVEKGTLELTTPVGMLIEGFDGGGREKVLLEHLLTHSSGLPSWRPLYREAHTREEVLSLILATPLSSQPGEVERYSDLGAILLGECAARAGGKPLATLSWELVFDPLALRDTFFNPPASERWRIAPTEEDSKFRHRLLHGEVHDENCFAMGGVSGHAGLFSTAEDLSRFAVEFLRSVRGVPGRRVFSTEIARRFSTRRELVKGSSRALGWDTRADESDGTGPTGSRSTSGSRFSPGSFGHTGFTGTSIWLDPTRDLFAILLSNRVHPGRDGPGMLEVRRAFHDAVVEGWKGPTNRQRLERAVRGLADAWFIIEDEGQPVGYHRIVTSITDEGDVVSSDEMVLARLVGHLSLRSEVTSGPDLLTPRQARAETRVGWERSAPALQGTVEFTDGDAGEASMKLSAVLFLDERGARRKSPRQFQEQKKRPEGPILFQSLVPLLLAYLPPTEEGSGLGEVVLAKFPAGVDRLIGLAPGRRLSITNNGGIRTVVLHPPEGESTTVSVLLDLEGKVLRIEAGGMVERRTSLEDVKKAFPGRL